MPVSGQNFCKKKTGCPAFFMVLIYWLSGKAALGSSSYMAGNEWAIPL